MGSKVSHLSQLIHAICSALSPSRTTKASWLWCSFWWLHRVGFTGWDRGAGVLGVVLGVGVGRVHLQLLRAVQRQRQRRRVGQQGGLPNPRARHRGRQLHKGSPDEAQPQNETRTVTLYLENYRCSSVSLKPDEHWWRLPLHPDWNPLHNPFPTVVTVPNL